MTSQRWGTFVRWFIGFTLAFHFVPHACSVGQGDLKSLHCELHSVCDKWFSLGVQLQVPIETLKSIRRENLPMTEPTARNADCLVEVYQPSPPPGTFSQKLLRVLLWGRSSWLNSWETSTAHKLRERWPMATLPNDYRSQFLSLPLISPLLQCLSRWYPSNNQEWYTYKRVSETVSVGWNTSWITTYITLLTPCHLPRFLPTLFPHHWQLNSFQYIFQSTTADWDFTPSSYTRYPLWNCICIYIYELYNFPFKQHTITCGIYSAMPI